MYAAASLNTTKSLQLISLHTTHTHTYKQRTLKERRKILEQNITPIKNHVQLSEYHFIQKPKELSVMIAKASVYIIYIGSLCGRLPKTAQEEYLYLGNTLFVSIPHKRKMHIIIKGYNTIYASFVYIVLYLVLYILRWLPPPTSY